MIEVPQTIPIPGRNMVYEVTARNNSGEEITMKYASDQGSDHPRKAATEEGYLVKAVRCVGALEKRETLNE